MRRTIRWEGRKVELELRRVGGRLEVIGLSIRGGGPLDSTVIRRLPFGALAEQAKAGTVETEGGSVTIYDPGAKAKAVALAPRSPGQPLPLSHFREVARVYRAAYRAGLHPTRAVADHFDRPLSTAGRWVSIARNVHHLLPVTDKYTPRA